MPKGSTTRRENLWEITIGNPAARTKFRIEGPKYLQNLGSDNTRKMIALAALWYMSGGFKQRQTGVRLSDSLLAPCVIGVILPLV
jgi:hypothetical protein